jgi:proteasome regulatory subunit
VRIIAATNRFDMLDEAILRPGRFDRLIEVPKPGVEGREQILSIHTRDMNVADDVDFGEIAAELDGYSGADINALTTEAGMFAIRDDRSVVQQSDFRDAREKVEDEEEGPVANSFRPYQY